MRLHYILVNQSTERITMTNQNIPIPNHEVVYMRTPHGPQPVYPMNGVWTYEQILQHQKQQQQQQREQVEAKRQQEQLLAKRKLQIKIMQKQQHFLYQQQKQHYVQAIQQQQQQPIQHLQLQQVPVYFDANNKENCNRLLNQPIPVISQNNTGTTVSPVMNQSSFGMPAQAAIIQHSSGIPVQTVIDQQNSGIRMQPVISQHDTGMGVQQSNYVLTEIDPVVPMQQSCFVPSPSLLQQLQVSTDTNDANYLPLSKNCADETTNSIPKWKIFWDSIEEKIFRREHTKNISHQEAVYLDLTIRDTKFGSIVKLQNVEHDFEEDINIMEEFTPNTNIVVEPSQVINKKNTSLPVKTATIVQVLKPIVDQDQEIKSKSNQSTTPSKSYQSTTPSKRYQSSIPSNTQPVRVFKNTEKQRTTDPSYTKEKTVSEKQRTTDPNYTKEKTVSETHSKAYRVESSSKPNNTSKVNFKETNVESVNSKTVKPKASSGSLKRSRIEQELLCQQMLSKKKKLNKKTKVIPPKKQPKHVEKSKPEEKESSLYVKLGGDEIKSKRLRGNKLKTQRSDSLGSAVISPPDSPKYSTLRPSNDGLRPINNDSHPTKNNLRPKDNNTYPAKNDLRPKDLSSAKIDDDFDRNFFSVMQSFFLP